MAAAPIATRAAVDPLVRHATAWLSALANHLPRSQPPEAANEVVEHELRRADRESPETPRPTRNTGRKPDAKPVGGILVRRAAVRAAVKRGIRPTGSPVSASGDRPAGLVVHGWGAAGVGLADGDIITRVGGRTPASVDDVVIAVAGAYKSRSPVVSGQIWRNGQVLAVTVELPVAKEDAEDQRGASRSTGGP